MDTENETELNLMKRPSSAERDEDASKKVRLSGTTNDENIHTEHDNEQTAQEHPTNSIVENILTKSDNESDPIFEIPRAEKSQKISKARLEDMIEASARRWGTPKERPDEKEHMLWAIEQRFRSKPDLEAMCLPRPKNAAQQLAYLTNAPPEAIVTGPLEETRHPWGTNSETLPPFMIRFWDRSSEAKMDNTSEGLLSRARGGFLHTEKERVRRMEAHVDFQNRSKTPFISLSSSTPDAVEFIPRFNRRQRRKDYDPEIHVTIVNPAARVAEGMPLLHVGREMDHYGAKMPYRKDSPSGKAIVRYQWLATWCIPPSQIVGDWLLRDIHDWMKRQNSGWRPIQSVDPVKYSHMFEKWVDTIVLPALERHETRRKQGLKPGPWASLKYQ